MDVYRTPDERFAGLPAYGFEPRYVEQDGLRMHYVEEGSGAPVLLLHGEPTWAFLYRKMIPPISQVARWADDPRFQTPGESWFVVRRGRNIRRRSAGQSHGDGAFQHANREPLRANVSAARSAT